MGDRARQRDSSEEGDRRDTRDKFRAERSTYDSGRRSQPESHPDKRAWAPQSGGPREHEGEPSAKRGRVGPADLGPSLTPAGEPRKFTTAGADGIEYQCQPPMLTFKQWLGKMNMPSDAINTADAIAKYQQYKEEFTRQQLYLFFEAHKSESWFREKYQPDACRAARVTHYRNVLRRLDIFLEFVRAGRIDGCSLTADNERSINKLLDSVVIKLEGGTDEDLQVLDEPATIATPATKPPAPPVSVAETSKEANGSTAASPQATTSANASGNVEGGEDGEVHESATAVEKLLQAEADTKPEFGEAGEVAEPEPETAPEELNPNKRRALHLSHSLFLPNVPVTVDKEKLLEVCSRIEGFKRLTLLDPVPERNFARRGWVTFDRRVRIKEICWSLNNSKEVRALFGQDKELGAKVNNDLVQHVRTLPVSSTSVSANVVQCAHDRGVMRQHLLAAVRIALAFDSRWGLWGAEFMSTSSSSSGSHAASGTPGAPEPPATSNATAKQPQQHTGSLSTLQSVEAALRTTQNPLLRHIEQYLVEEGDFEQQALLAMARGKPASALATVSLNDPFLIDFDPLLARVLDRLLLYLRVVHSVDLYATAEYTQEDELPNRCGIIHVRPAPPPPAAADGKAGEATATARVARFAFSPLERREVESLDASLTARLNSLVNLKERLSTEEAKKLGLKDPEAEVQRFISDNTQKIDEGKWLCPLSGKKFKGPEFVHKHIFTKLADKLAEARNDALFFDNYLSDAKRPQLPEHPNTRLVSMAAQQQRVQSGQMQMPGDLQLQSAPPPAQFASPGYPQPYAHPAGYPRPLMAGPPLRPPYSFAPRGGAPFQQHQRSFTGPQPQTGARGAYANR